MTLGAGYYDAMKYEHVESIFAWDKILGGSCIFGKAAFTMRLQSTGSQYTTLGATCFLEISDRWDRSFFQRKSLFNR